MDIDDPTITNADRYVLLWENEFVRVLDYQDVPGMETTPHRHPNSVMVTLTDFDRTLFTKSAERDIRLTVGQVVWLPAQVHAGRNIGTTPTHTILIELKGAAAGELGGTALGPAV
jgi:quercetin dioxygenase-like cupin family protein